MISEKYFGQINYTLPEPSVNNIHSGKFKSLGQIYIVNNTKLRSAN